MSPEDLQDSELGNKLGREEKQRKLGCSDTKHKKDLLAGIDSQKSSRSHFTEDSSQNGQGINIYELTCIFWGALNILYYTKILIPIFLVGWLMEGWVKKRSSLLNYKIRYLVSDSRVTRI